MRITRNNEMVKKKEMYTRRYIYILKYIQNIYPKNCDGV